MRQLLGLATPLKFLSTGLCGGSDLNCSLHGDNARKLAAEPLFATRQHCRTNYVHPTYVFAQTRELQMCMWLDSGDPWPHSLQMQAQSEAPDASGKACSRQARNSSSRIRCSNH